MNLATYDSYRETRLEWVDSLPSHWREGRLRWLTTRFAGGTPNKDRADYWDNGTIPWLNSGAVNQGLVIEPSAFITQAGFDNSSARWVPSGALVIALAGQGKTKGMVAELAIPCTCNQSMAAIMPNDELEARFLFWWLTSNYQNIRNMAGGDLRDGLNLELLGDIGCPIPPVSEQRQIGAFLDRETSKIAALIQEQKQLISLLHEKRLAAISNAVSGGLTPSVAMKDAGVAGLETIPAHWEIHALRRYLLYLTSGSRGWAEHYSDDGATFIRIGNLTRDSYHLDLSEVQRVAPPPGSEGERTRIQDGDVLFSITAFVGSVAVARDLETAFVSQHVALARIDQRKIKPEWVALCALSISGKTYWGAQAYGGAKMQLSLADVADLPLTVPPIEEQQDLIANVSKQLQEADALIAQCEEAIDLLSERRASLVSSAVIGRIDVQARHVPAIEPMSVRDVACAEIIRLCSHKPNFGRVKMQKIVYLAEAHLGISEIDGDYAREAAGPLDRALAQSIEKSLQDQGVVDVHQDGHGSLVTYRFTGQTKETKEAADCILGTRCTALRDFLKRIGNLDTLSVEAIATLYAVWNDALIDGETLDDAEIIRRVLEEWHPEKAEKFNSEALSGWLTYMRRNNIIPQGRGPRTHTPRLFP